MKKIFKNFFFKDSNKDVYRITPEDFNLDAMGQFLHDGISNIESVEEVRKRQITDDLHTYSISPALMEEEEKEETLNSYIEKDPQVVGYQDLETQYLFYNSVFNNLNFLGNVESLLDCGCGRGDFLDFLLRNDKNFKYVGVDNNEIHINLAKKNYSESDYVKFISSNIIDFSENTFYDVSVCVGTLALKYDQLSSVLDKYDYFNLILTKLLKVSNKAVIITLLHSDYITDPYVAHDPKEIYSILYNKNYKFIVDLSNSKYFFNVIILK